jgi:hypothetical protein
MNNTTFRSNEDAYERLHSLMNADPYRNVREEFLKNYNRNPWVRAGKKNKDKRDPNFGQFQSKVNAAINVFISVLTERNAWVRIKPRYVPAESVKKISDQITSSFHRHFIEPWEDRYLDEIYGSFDIVMYGKAIEHFPSPGCVYSENLPVERVFPDSAAEMNPKKWQYVFIVKDFTEGELKAMSKGNSDDKHYNFDQEYLKEILKTPETYAVGTSTSEVNKQNRGEVRESGKENIIPVAILYIKDRYKGKNRVSRYCFPAEIKNYDSSSTTKNPKIRLLQEDKGYVPGIENVVHVRSADITRSYWKFNSFARQIYLATSLYDKSMSLAIRGVRRNFTQFISTDNRESMSKMLERSDEEVQIVDPDVKFVQNQNQNQGVREVIEVMRQIMLDTENGQAMAQAPGTQNVKGYAITAKEAELRAQHTGEQESLKIKVLLSNDVRLYKEIYRRAVDLGASYEMKKSYEAFVADMKLANLPEEVYDIENLYFKPFYLAGGGSQSSKISNAQGVYNALTINPNSPGQEQAQKDLVGAYVGIENVDDYIASRPPQNPSIMKAGQENEALDNTYLNPANVPVNPDDKHVQELPVHIMDYEKKLQIVNGTIKMAVAQPNKMRKAILLSAATDLLSAQDNKGGHIMAHIQAAGVNKEGKAQLTELSSKMNSLQQMQDQMTAQLQQINEQFDQDMSESDLNSEKLRHTQAMNKSAEDHATRMNDIASFSHIEKQKGTNEARMSKQEFATQEKAQDLAYKEEQAKLKLEQEQVSNVIKTTAVKEQAAAKIASSKANKPAS